MQRTLSPAIACGLLPMSPRAASVAVASLALLVALATAAVAFAAGPLYFTDKLGTNPVLAVSQTPGAWYVDRYAPAAFESTTFAGQPRLQISISTSDATANRPSESRVRNRRCPSISASRGADRRG